MYLFLILSLFLLHCDFGMAPVLQGTGQTSACLLPERGIRLLHTMLERVVPVDLVDPAWFLLLFFLSGIYRS